MNHIFANSAEILLLLFLVISFIQSGMDKLIDWSGNLSWLKTHFLETAFKNVVPFLLGVLTFLEIISGALCAIGIVEIIISGSTTIAFYGALVSSITLLFLLIGQRLAKDYDGARTIVIYFVPAVFLVLLLQR